MATYIYCRVSTKEQVADGSSLPVQARECRRWVDSQGLTLGTATNYRNPGVFADPGVSAWRIPLLERPGFKSLWLSMKPGDNFVCLSLDRAFRSVKDFSTTWDHFDRAEINPIFIRSKVDMRTATGRLLGHIAASFAQFKSDMISQRVREGRRQARERNRIAPKLVQADNPLLAKVVGSLNDIVPPEHLSIDRGRVFGYARVSTCDQSLQSQMQVLTTTMDRIAGEGHFNTGRIYEDHGVSAFSVDWKDRPSGAELFDNLQPNDIVVVSQLDRIFRSVHDMAYTTKSLIERGIHLVTGCGLDTRTEIGRQGIEVMAMMAAWESRDNSWRVKMAMRNAQRLRGKWLSPDKAPRWMNVVDLKDGSWTMQPNMEWVSQFREVEEMTEAGMKPKEASDLMEERLAARQKRPLLPPLRFKPRYYRDVLKKRGITSEELAAYNEWVAQQTPDKNGEIERDWSWMRTKNARRHFETINELLSA